jgi:ABC-type molybdate transport system permease subunit
LSDFGVVALTVRTAILAAILMTPFGIAVAWLLARKQWPGKSIIETIVALPLVMPPVATGLILLKRSAAADRSARRSTHSDSTSSSRGARL